MAIAPLFQKALWLLITIGALYAALLFCLLSEWVQTQALYAHRINTIRWQDINKPEQFGFLKNQVQPFTIPTPDGETLYGWHILPLALYAKHEEVLLQEPPGPSSHITQTQAFKLLSTDPESRLLIYFHGNAGTVSQGWRTDTYRTLSTPSPSKIHVLTIDYRGFGHSSGTPSEKGLITDGVTLVKWAMEIARIPRDRIIIMGQSLGTAVSTAVAEHFVVESQTEFAGLVLVAAFSDIPTLMLTYSFGGAIPILSPLRIYPRLQRFLGGRIRDTWPTAIRLANLVRRSRDVNLILIHATNDLDIPWRHSDVLFYTAANATSEEGLTQKLVDGVKSHRELGEAGWINEWNAAGGSGGRKRIRQEIVRHGGHNRLVTYSSVARAVLDLFDL